MTRRPSGTPSSTSRRTTAARRARRLRVLLETILGGVSVAAGCEDLRVSESRLHGMWRQALVGALGALMSKPSGRPATADTTPLREQELLARIGGLEVDLQAA